MTQWRGLCLGSLLTALLPGATTVADDPIQGQPPAPPLVRIENGLLSLLAQNASLSEILTAIEQASGVEVEVQGEAGQARVSQSMTARPLADGLNELLNGRNYLLLYKGRGKDKRVSKVILSSVASPSTLTSASAAESSPLPSAEIPSPSKPDSDELRQGPIPDVTGPAGNAPGSPPPPAGVATQPEGAPPLKPSSPFPYLNAIQRQNEARQGTQRSAGPQLPAENP